MILPNWAYIGLFQAVLVFTRLPTQTKMDPLYITWEIPCYQSEHHYGQFSKCKKSVCLYIFIHQNINAVSNLTLENPLTFKYFLQSFFLRVVLFSKHKQKVLRLQPVKHTKSHTSTEGNTNGNFAMCQNSMVP